MKYLLFNELNKTNISKHWTKNLKIIMIKSHTSEFIKYFNDILEFINLIEIEVLLFIFVCGVEVDSLKKIKMKNIFYSYSYVDIDFAVTVEKKLKEKYFFIDSYVNDSLLNDFKFLKKL
jgi:hypothetical protein